MAVNQALVRREALSRRREEYVGQWLPEPLVAESGDEGPETVLRAESFSMAVMVVLESPTSLERAVFVLNEVFGYRHTEIAEMLDRSPAAVRRSLTGPANTSRRADRVPGPIRASAGR
jgi:RNA polymerase sigma-70 factor (ECF subfamily)